MPTKPAPTLTSGAVVALCTHAAHLLAAPGVVVRVGLDSTTISLPYALNPATIESLARTLRLTGTGLGVCRGCGIVFEIPEGGAGVFCSRACYTDPERHGRKAKGR